MNARDIESALLAGCAAVARDEAQSARDQREANVFRLAAMVVQSRLPDESRNLVRASEQYFAAHPDDKVAAEDVVRSGWVQSLHRLRDSPSRKLGSY
jgi:ElaB/YqjD/DUF883 family membrane-anchored ribosome-binding protein